MAEATQTDADKVEPLQVTEGGESRVFEREPYDKKSTLVALLCMIASLEGADNSLFPATIGALNITLGLTPSQIGFLGMTQALAQAAAGPLWGIVASRGVIPRKHILVFGCIAQGTVTCILAFATNLPLMLFLRSLNGIMLASLRPISNGIIADAFPDLERGRIYGFLFMALAAGAAVSSLIATPISKDIIAGFFGWQVAFFIVGLISMALGPIIGLVMTDLPVRVSLNAGTGVLAELSTLVRLMGTPTFAAVVLQGCFGIIPWRALDFRILFFQVSGLSDGTSAILNSVGQLSGAFGGVIGGFMGDALAKINKIHGRIWTAEIAVFSSIPICFFTFMVAPPFERAVYWGLCVAALGLMATWSATGTNPPLLCTVSTESERSLVLAWQASLEGGVGSTGSILFGFFAENVFGFDSSNEQVSDKNATAVGRSLFWCCCLPWVLCGLFYASLHYFYPRDLGRTMKRQTTEDLSSLEYKS